MQSLRYRRLWLAIGYALIGLILYLSLTSSPVRIDTGFPYQDKLFHLLAYFTLTAWFVQLYPSRQALNRWVFAFVLMGLALEYAQSFDTRRYAEFGDMIANTIGVMLGYAVSATPLKDVLLRVEAWLKA